MLRLDSLAFGSAMVSPPVAGICPVLFGAPLGLNPRGGGFYNNQSLIKMSVDRGGSTTIADPGCP